MNKIFNYKKINFYKSINFLIINILLISACTAKNQVYNPERPASDLLTGADQLDLYLPLLKGKRTALVVNQTSIVKNQHLVDTLLSQNIQITKVFAPEHGFRGDADAGEHVKNSIDTRTQLPIISLYGDNKKPTAAQLSDVDVLLFDIQDVGARFYTYISTLHYVMEACAEQNKLLLVLDRPNPNGHYVDGPILDKKFQSFVGMHPIPIVHGLTVGELASMINGEKWLAGGKTCQLEVITNKNYDHNTPYSLPVKPSPNLPNDQAIKLYPSLCFFEGTIISLGRGTHYPFQVIGYPDERFGNFTFTPVSIVGMAKNPPHENKVCYGLDLRDTKLSENFTLEYLIKFYQLAPDKDKFFNAFFNKLAGNDILQKQIKDGLSENEIKKSWEKDLNAYKIMRKQYLLYPDFNN
jgi:uncharacterized protein YbbC (DUF1343 family)